MDVDPRVEARERIRVAEAIYEAARKTHDADPSRINRISLKAARRLLKETIAQGQEWVC